MTEQINCACGDSMRIWATASLLTRTMEQMFREAHTDKGHNTTTERPDHRITGYEKVNPPTGVDDAPWTAVDCECGWRRRARSKTRVDRLWFAHRMSSMVAEGRWDPDRHLHKDTP